MNPCQRCWCGRRSSSRSYSKPFIAHGKIELRRWRPQRAVRATASLVLLRRPRRRRRRRRKVLRLPARRAQRQVHLQVSSKMSFEVTVSWWACRLGKSEKQHVMTLTRNSTRFNFIRRALRTLFSDDPQEQHHGREHGHGHQPRGGRGVWWADEWEGHETGGHDGWWQPDEVAYYDEDSEYGWDYDENYEDTEIRDEETGLNASFEDVGDSEEAKAYEHALTVSQAATKTLNEARQAVAKVRAARGYFDASGTKGTGQSFKGMSKGPSSSKSGKGKGFPRKGKGSRTSFGPCFICGSPSHGYANCPDRWSKGQAKGSSKSRGKSGKGGKRPCGAGKGSYYGETYHYTDSYPFYEFYVDISAYDDLDYVNVLSLTTDAEAYSLGTAKVILDTGATESVAGVASMARLLDNAGVETQYRVALSDRPRFKFGNGMTQQATSRIDIQTNAMGTMSFYLLDGEAENTPPLVGGRELQGRGAAISYEHLCIAHQSQSHGGQWLVNHVFLLRGKHILMDLNEIPLRMRGAPENWLLGLPRRPRGGGGGHDGYGDDDDDDYGGDHPGGPRPSQVKPFNVFGHRSRTRSPPGGVDDDTPSAPPASVYPSPSPVEEGTGSPTASPEISFPADSPLAHEAPEESPAEASSVSPGLPVQTQDEQKAVAEQASGS